MALAVVMLWDRRGEPSSTMDLVLIVIGAVGFFLTSYGVVIAGVRRALRELDLDPTNQSD